MLQILNCCSFPFFPAKNGSTLTCVPHVQDLLNAMLTHQLIFLEKQSIYILVMIKAVNHFKFFAGGGDAEALALLFYLLKNLFKSFPHTNYGSKICFVYTDFYKQNRFIEISWNLYCFSSCPASNVNTFYKYSPSAQVGKNCQNQLSW